MTKTWNRLDLLIGEGLEKNWVCGKNDRICEEKPVLRLFIIIAILFGDDLLLIWNPGCLLSQACTLLQTRQPGFRIKSKL